MKSASLWGCELKYLIFLSFRFNHSSASLWGCELKCAWCIFRTIRCIVSLLVRLWVEIILLVCFYPNKTSQPPCEAVSWNAICTKHLLLYLRQPPCEAVSWNLETKLTKTLQRSQPPCEAVSWNYIISLFVSTLQCQPPCEAVSWNVLFSVNKKRNTKSASLWGCELKYIRCRTKSIDCRQPPCEAVSWNIKHLL